MFDFHIHSTFSPDSDMKMEEAILAAIEKNLKEICFTDHVDYDYHNIHNDFIFDYEDYFTAIYHLKEKYKNKITIRVGVEMGLQPNLMDQCSKDVKDNNFDFVIASIHSVEDFDDLYYGHFYQNKSQEASYNTYLNNLSYIMERYKDYSVLGHLDIVKRYGNYDAPLPLDAYREYIIEVLKKIIKNGKGIELNTSGVRYNLGDYHPSLDIIQLYHQLGGEIITIGSDAHQPHQVAFDFHRAIKSLKDIGFKYLTTFKEMQPVFHKIDGF